MTITQTQQTKILPQFVFGGGWYTALYFTATPDSDASFTVNFIGDNGAPLNVPALGGSSVNVTMSAGSTTLLEAPNVGPDLIRGYVSVTLPPNVTGYGVFRQTVPGRPDQEATVPFVNASSKTMTIIWDENGFSTGAAFVNLGSGNQVTITVRGAGGGVIDTQVVPLAPNTKTSKTFEEIFGTELAGRRGAADFTVSSGAVAVLGLRFGSAAFTDIPAN